MEDQAVFSVLAQCFGPVGQQEWEELTTAALWNDFLSAVRGLLQDDRPLGEDAPGIARLASRRPLQEFLAERELKALFLPPSFEERERFAARHFTGGLPGSTLPVESLYQPQAGGTCQQAGKEGGMYLGEPARYVQDVARRMGMAIPAAFAACPDHLALELDMVAVLLRSGLRQEARQFLMERFAWLTAFRKRLIAMADASFTIALVDVVLGIRTQQEAACNNGPADERPDLAVSDTIKTIERKQLCQNTL